MQKPIVPMFATNVLAKISEIMMVFVVMVNVMVIVMVNVMVI